MVAPIVVLLPRDNVPPKLIFRLLEKIQDIDVYPQLIKSITLRNPEPRNCDESFRKRRKYSNKSIARKRRDFKGVTSLESDNDNCNAKPVLSCCEKKQLSSSEEAKVRPSEDCVCSLRNVDFSLPLSFSDVQKNHSLDDLIQKRIKEENHEEYVCAISNNVFEEPMSLYEEYGEIKEETTKKVGIHREGEKLSASIMNLDQMIIRRLLCNIIDQLETRRDNEKHYIQEFGGHSSYWSSFSKSKLPEKNASVIGTQGSNSYSLRECTPSNAQKNNTSANLSIPKITDQGGSSKMISHRNLKILKVMNKFVGSCELSCSLLPICNLRCSNVSTVVSHLMSHVTIRPAIYRCSWCNLDTNYLTNIRRHARQYHKRKTITRHSHYTEKWTDEVVSILLNATSKSFPGCEKLVECFLMEMQSESKKTLDIWEKKIRRRSLI